MPQRITVLRAHDVRFPTSDESHGSDAMNPHPDYSAAVAILETDDPSLTGHGLTFTIGRGTNQVLQIAEMRVAIEHSRISLVSPCRYKIEALTPGGVVVEGTRAQQALIKPGSTVYNDKSTTFASSGIKIFCPTSAILLFSTLII